MSRVSLLAPVLACGIALAGPVSGVKAGLLPVSVSVAAEAENFRWTYAIVLPTDAMIRAGDYFTIYDFAGLIANSNSQPDNWGFTSSNTGDTPDDIVSEDNPDLPNLTWRYTGPEVASGQVGLGNFWASSEFGDATESLFTAQTHRTSDGRVDSNITPTTVPVPHDGGGPPPGEEPPPGVPEPATLALAGLGLPLIGLARRLRRAK